MAIPRYTSDPGYTNYYNPANDYSWDDVQRVAQRNGHTAGQTPSTAPGGPPSAQSDGTSSSINNGSFISTGTSARPASIPSGQPASYADGAMTTPNGGVPPGFPYNPTAAVHAFSAVPRTPPAAAPPTGPARTPQPGDPDYVGAPGFPAPTNPPPAGSPTTTTTTPPPASSVSSAYKSAKDYLQAFLAGGPNYSPAEIQQYLSIANKEFNLPANGQAVYYPAGTHGPTDLGTIGLPEGYFALTDKGWNWVDRGPESGAGSPNTGSGSLGTAGAPYTFTQFTPPDYSGISGLQDNVLQDILRNPTLSPEYIQRLMEQQKETLAAGAHALEQRAAQDAVNRGVAGGSSIPSYNQAIEQDYIRNLVGSQRDIQNTAETTNREGFVNALAASNSTLKNRADIATQFYDALLRGQQSQSGLDFEYNNANLNAYQNFLRLIFGA